MYAIIRTGGKQAKVAVGDVIDVERLRAEDEVTFTPLLLVDDDGNVTSGRAELADAKVVAKVLGPSAGPKIDIFKYKAKTGYRRRQGHRQKYTRIEITGISSAADAAEKLPKDDKKKKPEAEKAEAKPEAKKAEAKPEAKKAEAKPEAKKAEAKPEAKKAEAKPEAKKAEAKPEAKKAEAKPEAKKAEAKPEAKKAEAKPEAKATDEKPKTTAKATAANEKPKVPEDGEE